MKNETIMIRKEAGTKKDAFRVTDKNSIPEFLKDTVTIDERNQVHLVCVEGDETCELGQVIGWEESEKTRTGWNTWVIGNAATNLIEEDGVFYKKATVFKAAPLSDKLPEFLEGGDVHHNADGSWTIKTSWGESTGFPGEAYWVLYGVKSDGKPDANILTKSEKSYADYFVCEEDGTIISSLVEYDHL